MENFPSIESERLVLGKIKIKYIEKIIQYANNEKVAQNLLSFPFPYTEKDAITWINGQNEGFTSKKNYIFAICKKIYDEFIGGVGLHIDIANNKAELGYWIAEPFWGNGYATEAVEKILEFGFKSLKLNKIYGRHFTDNPASGKVLVKNKMVQEGELKAEIKKGELYKDLIVYRLTKDEYFQL